MISPGKLLFSLTCVGMIVYGVLDYISNFEQNNCLMTYMFEMPEYIHIPLGKRLSSQFPRYKLYIYGEGELAHKLRKRLSVTGVPVLFIPGNAGSHKQARSLASVAYRRAHDKRADFHFDYFTVDFNEELSALYGGMLYDQTEFVHGCIKKILMMYKDTTFIPQSVILVGHSMGGMIARGLFTLPGFNEKMVTTIITQATPHQFPVIALDRQIADYYKTVNGYWRTHSNTTLSHVTIVSTGGGYRDVLVRNGLTSLRGIANPELSVSTSTMSVPYSWVSTDHLCAVWCKQMVMLTKRAMFDIVDKVTYQVNVDGRKRMDVFRHYFIHHPGTHAVPDFWRSEITLDAEIPWVIKKEKTWEFVKNRVQQDYYYAVPMNKEGVNSFVAISNVDLKEWVCICKMKESESRCKKCTDLSQKGKAIPPTGSYRKIIHIDFKDYPDMTHIVLIIPAVTHQVEVMGDSYDKDYRHLSYKLPSVPDILLTYPESVTTGASVLTLHNDSLFYSLKLKGLDSVLRAYNVKLIPKHCNVNTGLHEGNMMSLHIPWSNEDIYAFSRINQVGNLSIKLQSGAPVDSVTKENIFLKIYTDPACSYQLKIIAAPSESLGQLVRFYGKLFPCFMVVIVLMGLLYQLHTIRKERSCPDIVEAVGAFGAPFRILPVVALLQFCLQTDVLEKFIPGDDSKELISQGINSQLLPICVYIISLGIVNFHCVLLITGLKTVTTVVAVIFKWLPVSVLTIIGKLKYLVLVLALVFCMLCGSVGIIISYITLVFWVSRLCHLARVSSLQDNVTKFNLSVPLLILCMWTTAFNIPAAISWSKNIRYTMFLSDFTNSMMSILTVVAISAIVVLDDPLSAKDLYYFLVPAVYGINVLLLLYGMTSAYRIVYATTLVLSAIAATQLYYRIKHGYSNKNRNTKLN